MLKPKRQTHFSKSHAALPAKPDLKELARSIASPFASALAHTLAPGSEEDDLLNAKGPDTYDKMLTDSQVRSCLEIKKYSVLGQEWAVRPKSPGAQARGIADFCQEQLEGLSGGWFQAADGILDCIAHGRSIAEILWQPLPDGQCGLKAIKPKNPRHFGFDCDPFGNLKSLLYRPESSLETVHLPVDKFVIAVYRRRYGSWLGQSDLRAAYRPWFIKDNLLRFWAVWLERFGAPIALGKYPRQTTPQERKEFEQVLRRLHADAGALLPEDLEIEFKEATRGATSFREAIEYMDDAIAKAILGQTLTTSEGRRSGSLALGRVHENTQSLFFAVLGKLLETVVEDQILKRLVAYNFPVGPELVPEFVIGPSDDPFESEGAAPEGIAEYLGGDLNAFQTELQGVLRQRPQSQAHG